MATIEKELGRVKWFNRTKGYGFIIADNDDVELFVHYSDIVEGGQYEKNLEDGQKVRFRREHGERGLKAMAVEKLRS